MNIDEPVVCQVKRKFLAGICIDFPMTNALGWRAFLLSAQAGFKTRIVQQQATAKGC